MKERLIQFAADKIKLDPLPQVKANDAEMARILTVVFGLAGSIALLVIVIGGFRYVISRGDPNNVAQAKHTILYGIVGLIVVIVSASIVGFVIGLAQ